jgi:uncharacterized protein YbcI
LKCSLERGGAGQCGRSCAVRLSGACLFQDLTADGPLKGGFTKVAQTLLDGGRGAAVIQQRMQFQQLMRERFEAVIEEAVGREVVGYMSGNQQEPDMMCEVFVLGADPFPRSSAGPTGLRNSIQRRQSFRTAGRGQPKGVSQLTALSSKPGADQWLCLRPPKPGT